MSNILRIPPRRAPPAASKMELDMPQIMTINQVGAPSSEPDFEDEYVTDEEEVDEIIDDEPPPTLRKTNGKGKAKATPNNFTPSGTPGPAEPPLAKPKLEKVVPPLPPRKPGETHIDQQRVEKIIKAHGDMLPPSKDAVFLISLAAEEFVKRLAETGRRHASNDKRASIDQCDMALAAQIDRGYSFLRETVPTAIPLYLALEKHAQKENERTLIATQLTHSLPSIGNGTSTHSHKKRQPPLPKSQAAAKGKTRTSARQANGRPSITSTSAASTSTPTSAADVTAISSPRPKRAAAQKGRFSLETDGDGDVEFYDVEQTPPMEVDNNTPPSGADVSAISYPRPKRAASQKVRLNLVADGDGDPEFYDDEQEHTPSMVVEDAAMPWRAPSRQNFGSTGAGRGGIMKGFGPGAYGKVGGLAGRAGSGSPPQARNSWGFPPEPPRNTGRTIYSDRTDEEARKAAVEAEEQLRYKLARQKIEQELMKQDAPEPQPGWTPENQDDR